MPNSAGPRTIVLHDLFRMRGGGERLALILARNLAQALCYGYRTPDSYDSEAMAGLRIIDLAVGRGPFGIRTLRLMHAFRRRTGFLSAYDMAIYHGFFAPLAVQNHPRGHNIYYCSAPPRFAYDQYDFHLSRLSPLKRLCTRVYVPRLRAQFEAAARRMDVVVVNSRNVQQRIRRYFDLETEIVHPPCDTQRYRWGGQDGYYLSTARLDPLKRVDVIVRAFRTLPQHRLIVMSGGDELPRLKELAGEAPNISFTGWVGEEEQTRLIGQAVATLYIPRDEDFGMSPVESMAAGKPVIGVAEGGLLETVIPGETGILLPPDPGPEEVAAAVTQLTPARALEMRQNCETRAKAFDTELFVRRMSEIVARFY